MKSSWIWNRECYYRTTAFSLLLLALCTVSQRNLAAQESRDLKFAVGKQAGGKSSRKVSDAKAESDDWLTVNKNAFSQRYVNLDHINRSNVKDLGLISELEIDEPSWFSSGILKVGRTLYFTTRRMTFAVDAVSCRKIWRYVNTEQPKPATSNNRRLACLEGADGKPGLLFRGTANGHMLALNAENGQVVWDNAAADPTINESLVAGPGRR